MISLSTHLPILHKVAKGINIVDFRDILINLRGAVLGGGACGCQNGAATAAEIYVTLKLAHCRCCWN